MWGDWVQPEAGKVPGACRAIFCGLLVLPIIHSKKCPLHFCQQCTNGDQRTLWLWRCSEAVPPHNGGVRWRWGATPPHNRGGDWGWGAGGACSALRFVLFYFGVLISPFHSFYYCIHYCQILQSTTPGNRKCWQAP